MYDNSTPEELERIREMMDDEYTSAQFYTALAKRFSRQNCERLLQAARDEAGHLRALQMEYFLLTGDSYTPTARDIEIRSCLSALRDGYHAERKAYDTYMEMAQDTSSTELAAVFIANAADEARHAQMLRGLIEKALR